MGKPFDAITHDRFMANLERDKAAVFLTTGTDIVNARNLGGDAGKWSRYYADRCIADAEALEARADAAERAQVGRAA